MSHKMRGWAPQTPQTPQTIDRRICPRDDPRKINLLLIALGSAVRDYGIMQAELTNAACCSAGLKLQRLAIVSSTATADTDHG